MGGETGGRCWELDRRCAVGSAPLDALGRGAGRWPEAGVEGTRWEEWGSGRVPAGGGGRRGKLEGGFGEEPSNRDDQLGILAGTEPTGY
jgi:hypothetical protein